MGLVIDILVEAEGWSILGDIDALTRQTVEATLGGSGVEVSGDEEFSILLCDDARIRELNRQFRGQDKATNVLSFPAAIETAPETLGDIAVAFETVAREADDEHKNLRDHYAHMIAHGVLHLLGFDHEADDEAEEMEQLEREILSSLGIADPYRDIEGGARAP